MYIVGQGVTYLLMASLPTTQMVMLWAARRLSVHQIRLLRPRFPDRKVETAGRPEIGDASSTGSRVIWQKLNESFLLWLEKLSVH